MSSSRLPRALGELGPRDLLINETFFSIQGESSHAGQPCFFIRLTGCHLRCVWCDSEYAFFEGEQRSVDDCVREASDIGCELVEVTGGEPLLQKAVYALMAELCDAGKRVLLETSGAVPIDRVDPRVSRIVDWKTPGSGEVARNHPDLIGSLRDGDELKLVVADRKDYEWTRDWIRTLTASRADIGTKIPIHLSPVFGSLSNENLASWILEDRLPARLNLQLHKYVWDPDARGV